MKDNVAAVGGHPEAAMGSMTRGKQVAVDLAGYPGLVVIYLGMRVNTLRG
jgi:hypothetical protein